MATDCVIQLNRVARTFKSQNRTFTVAVPRLDVVAGHFYAIVGPSGSGKSTLLDMLGLIRSPSQAETFSFRPFSAGAQVDIAALWRHGHEGRLADLRRLAIGYVLQTGGLLPYLNIRRNVGLPAQLLGASPRAVEIDALLGEFGIAAHAAKHPGQLSGGERQRAAIARALVNRPALVLADEPTAAVDARLAQGIVATLAERARAENAAVVMVTHDESLIDPVADMKIRLTCVDETESGVFYRTREERR